MKVLVDMKIIFLSNSMRLFFLCFFTVIICSASGQKVPGYIIIGGNDTLKGIVNIKAIGMLYQKVNFIYSRKVYKIRPGEISEYGFIKNNKSYTFESTLSKWSKLLIQKKRILFLQVLERGAIGCYKYDGDLDEVIAPYSFFYKDDKIEYIKMDDIKFLQQIRNLFADDELLFEQLGKAGYKKDDLIKMIHEYNIRKTYKRI